MFGTILRKKVSDDKLANVFINGLFSTIDNGFPIIADFINEDQAFVHSPGIQHNQSYEFSLVIVVGNLSFLENLLFFEDIYLVHELNKVLFFSKVTINRCKTNISNRI